MEEVIYELLNRIGGQLNRELGRALCPNAEIGPLLLLLSNRLLRIEPLLQLAY